MADRVRKRPAAACGTCAAGAPGGGGVLEEAEGAAERKRLVATDLDGTLTQHKSPATPACLAALKALSERYRLLLLCAGGCERVFGQLCGFPADIAGFYGMQFSTVRDGIFTITESRSVPADKDDVSARAKALRRELGLLEYDGDSVEFHASGMITFPMLGTAAPAEKKSVCDPDRKKRRGCYERVREAFGEYTVFIGGSSSFDIVPKPYCKLYAMERYLQRHGIGREEAICFGDDYGPGGNDSDLYNSGIEFVRVDDYREFPAIAAKRLLPGSGEAKI